MSSDEPGNAVRREVLKTAVGVLQDAEVRFALAGGYALWVHGAPEPSHDVDFVVLEEDVERARKALADADFTIEHPPEDWLFKAYHRGVLVDILHQVNGLPVDPELLDSADLEQVLGVWVRVLPATCIVRAKLLALNEHYCDFSALLPTVRAVREQLDWQLIEQQTASNDFAVAFLVLAERLAIKG